MFAIITKTCFNFNILRLFSAYFLVVTVRDLLYSSVSEDINRDEPMSAMNEFVDQHAPSPVRYQQVKFHIVFSLLCEFFFISLLSSHCVCFPCNTCCQPCVLQDQTTHPSAYCVANPQTRPTRVIIADSSWMEVCGLYICLYTCIYTHSILNTSKLVCSTTCFNAAFYMTSLSYVMSITMTSHV